MPTLIACCPHDTPTRYGYFYLRDVLTPIFTRHGQQVIFLKSATRENFRKALEQYDPDLVILNGHGGYKGVKGCDEVILGVATYDPVFQEKQHQENPEWMRGRIVYLFTCNTGRELAYRLVQSGAEAVAAYQSAFLFASNDPPDPPRDQAAYPFFNAALELPLSLVEGETFSTGVQNTKNAFKAAVEEAEKNRDKDTAKYLWHDLTNFVAIGNMNAKLYQTPILLHQNF